MSLKLSQTAAAIDAGNHVHVVTYGDSISEIARTPGYAGGASDVEHHYSTVLRDRLSAAYPESRFVIKPFGIGGQNSYEGLGRLDWIPSEPTLVVVAFGANDCGYHVLPPEQTGVALTALVTGIQARTNADVVLVGTGGDNPRNSNMNHVEETVAATRAVAVQQGVPYVDMRSAMLAATEDGLRWADYHNGEADCHPNNAGHALWGESIATVILEAMQ